MNFKLRISAKQLLNSAILTIGSPVNTGYPVDLVSYSQLVAAIKRGLVEYGFTYFTPELSSKDNIWYLTLLSGELPEVITVDDAKTAEKILESLMQDKEGKVYRVEKGIYKSILRKIQKRKYYLRKRSHKSSYINLVELRATIVRTHDATFDVLLFLTTGIINDKRIYS